MIYYLSYYREPFSLKELYLFKNVEGDWEYTDNVKDAYHFETRMEAVMMSPMYDGSNNIEKRSGVIMIGE